MSEVAMAQHIPYVFNADHEAEIYNLLQFLWDNTPPLMTSFYKASGILLDEEGGLSELGLMPALSTFRNVYCLNIHPFIEMLNY